MKDQSVDKSAAGKLDSMAAQKLAAQSRQRAQVAIVIACLAIVLAAAIVAVLYDVAHSAAVLLASGGALLVAWIPFLAVQRKIDNRLGAIDEGIANLSRQLCDSDVRSEEIRGGLVALHRSTDDALRRLRFVHKLVQEAQATSEERAALQSDLMRRVDSLHRELGEHSRQVRRQLDAKVTALRQRVERVPGEVVGLASATDGLMRPGHDMPALGGWAITPPTLCAMLNEVARRPWIETIVECGSGASTVWLGLACKCRGQGHVYALEHSPEFARKTRAFLAHNNLNEWVTVVDAPLVPTDVEGELYQWYALDGLNHVSSIDMLIVDGPPAATGEKARYPAFYALSGRLKDDAWVMLDDTGREDERRIVEDWCSASLNINLSVRLELPEATVMIAKFAAARSGVIDEC